MPVNVAGILLAPIFNSMFDNFDRKDFDLSVRSGQGEFRNLNIKPSFLNGILVDFFPAFVFLNMRIITARVNKLTVKFNIISHRSKPFRLEIDAVEVEMEEPDNLSVGWHDQLDENGDDASDDVSTEGSISLHESSMRDATDAMASSSKSRKLRRTQSEYIGPHASSSADPSASTASTPSTPSSGSRLKRTMSRAAGWLSKTSYSRDIMDAIQIKIGIIRVRLESRGPWATRMPGPWSPPVAYLIVRDVEIYQTNHEWQPIKPRDARDKYWERDEARLYKRMDVGSASFYLCDPVKAHSDKFTPPPPSPDQGSEKDKKRSRRKQKKSADKADKAAAEANKSQAQADGEDGPASATSLPDGAFPIQEHIGLQMNLIVFRKEGRLAAVECQGHLSFKHDVFFDPDRLGSILQFIQGVQAAIDRVGLREEVRSVKKKMKQHKANVPRTHVILNIVIPQLKLIFEAPSDVVGERHRFMLDIDGWMMTYIKHGKRDEAKSSLQCSFGSLAVNHNVDNTSLLRPFVFKSEESGLLQDCRPRRPPSIDMQPVAVDLEAERGFLLKKKGVPDFLRLKLDYKHIPHRHFDLSIQLQPVFLCVHGEPAAAFSSLLVGFADHISRVEAARPPPSEEQLIYHSRRSIHRLRGLVVAKERRPVIMKLQDVHCLFLFPKPGTSAALPSLEDAISMKVQDARVEVKAGSRENEAQANRIEAALALRRVFVHVLHPKLSKTLHLSCLGNNTGTALVGTGLGTDRGMRSLALQAEMLGEEADGDELLRRGSQYDADVDRDEPEILRFQPVRETSTA